MSADAGTVGAGAVSATAAGARIGGGMTAAAAAETGDGSTAAGAETAGEICINNTKGPALCKVTVACICRLECVCKSWLHTLLFSCTKVCPTCAHLRCLPACS